MNRKELNESKARRKNKDKKSVIEKEQNMKVQKPIEDEVRLGTVCFPENPPPYVPPILYPLRLVKMKLDKQFGKFLVVFKKLHINIPFSNAFAQMPSYVKFMKDILSNKVDVGRV